MTGEWNSELPVQETERVQIWIIGNREQVNHAINEFYVKRIATDFLRKHFVSACSLRRSCLLTLPQGNT